jgi:putative heme-binding domain-containing protein
MRSSLLGIVAAAWLGTSHADAPPPNAPAIPPPATGSLARNFTVLPGFQIDGVYRVPSDQGSWVSMTLDPKGRIITSDQFGKLYRVSLSPTQAPPMVEALDLEVGSAQGLLYAFDSLYVVVNRKREGPDQPGSGLYRARAVQGGDQFEPAQLLREIDGDGEHGPHAVVAGPDGRSLFVLGGNASPLPNPERSLVPRRWGEDGLLPRLGQTDGLFQPNRPGGWIVRTDPEGHRFELVAIGLRNPYDLAFNAAAELFTFDSDMEWDMGTPWYRPTRVLHVTSGVDFGWRTGSHKWPDYYPDSLPPVVDVGPSSPTGMVFGYGARFPAQFQTALFLADWSYGKIYALQLEPHGSTYAGQFVQFLAGTPMAITDLLIHPGDGALYFIVGGRGTSSALYRVRYRGPENTQPVPLTTTPGSGSRAERHRLESYHGRMDPEAIVVAWPYLDHRDPALRAAARIAIEHQPTAGWQERALTDPRPRGRTAALIALARCGEPALQPQIVRSLTQIAWDSLSAPEQVDLLRTFALAFIRMGPPLTATRELALSYLDPRYPAGKFEVNRELCPLLIYLGAPGVVGRTLVLVDGSLVQEEQLHYALCLRTAGPALWSVDESKMFFGWLNRTAANRGGVTFPEYLRQIRLDTINRLSPTSLAALGDLIIEPAPTDPYAELKSRPFVRAWTVNGLLPALEHLKTTPNLEIGRQIFAEAMCGRCHRVNRSGGITGPDLTGVTRRFDLQALLEAVLEPSRVVSDQYSTVEITTRDGDSIIGRIADLNDDYIQVLTDLINPAAFQRIPHPEIVDIVPSRLSMMPTGLLDHFTETEIRDLIAYLDSAGR